MMRRSREGFVPIVNWFAFLKNVADRWMGKIKVAIATNGYKDNTWISAIPRVPLVITRMGWRDGMQVPAKTGSQLNSAAS